jgi:hypothetical protein
MPRTMTPALPSQEQLVAKDETSYYNGYCNAEGSLCLNLGLVQYVQTNVNGLVGNWHAVVSGKGTFSFNAMATSAI